MPAQTSQHKRLCQHKHIHHKRTDAQITKQHRQALANSGSVRGGMTTDHWRRSIVSRLTWIVLCEGETLSSLFVRDFNRPGALQTLVKFVLPIIFTRVFCASFRKKNGNRVCANARKTGWRRLAVPAEQHGARRSSAKVKGQPCGNF